MKIAMRRPMAFIVARPRSLMTLRSCPGRQPAHGNDAAMRMTAKMTRL
jgi:hypothetical protein